MPFYYTKNKKGRDKMAHCENNNPVLFDLYTENKHITSDRKVFDGVIDMGGLPDSYIGVTATIDNKILVEITDDRAPQEGEFKVDYRHGWLYINPDVYNGKTLNLDFYSRGIELTPASRIYTFDKNGKVDIHTTLQDYINMANNSVVFTESNTLGNIVSGESFPTILGKISKWYTEKISKLKKLAFKDTVNTSEISDGAVTTSKLAKGAVTQDKIADKLAKLDSPNFSGAPTVPTPNIENNSTQIANTAYVRNAINQYGEKQVVYTPHMSPDGTLSWTNNGGKDNPEPVNLKGDTGSSAVVDSALDEYSNNAISNSAVTNAFNQFMPQELKEVSIEHMNGSNILYDLDVSSLSVNEVFVLINSNREDFTDIQVSDEYVYNLSSSIGARTRHLCRLTKKAHGGAEVENGQIDILWLITNI